MKSVLILTGDGGESYECWYAIHRLREEGYQAVVAAREKRRLNLVMHDFEPGWDTYVERRGYGVEAELAFDDIRPADFDAVLILGGRAPEYLRSDVRVLAIVRSFGEMGKWVFAICHGIQVLIAAGMVKGRRVTCYEHVKFEVIQAGGKWEHWQAVRDKNLVTAQTWESHPEFYREVMACLAT
jgi:protease I